VRNPDPVIVRAKEPDPAGALFGLMDEIVGGVELLVPPPVVLPELPEFEPPPQPLISTDTPRPKHRAKKRKDCMKSSITSEL
jgi:hypothetical protein